MDDQINRIQQVSRTTKNPLSRGVTGPLSRSILNFVNPAGKADGLQRNVVGYMNYLADGQLYVSNAMAELRRTQKTMLNTSRLKIAADGSIKGLPGGQTWRDVFRNGSPFDAASGETKYIATFNKLNNEIQELVRWMKESRGLDNIEVEDFYDHLDSIWDELPRRVKINPTGLMEDFLHRKYQELAHDELLKSVKESPYAKKVGDFVPDLEAKLLEAKARADKAALQVGKRIAVIEPGVTRPTLTAAQQLGRTATRLDAAKKSVRDLTSQLKGRQPEDINALEQAVEAAKARAKAAQEEVGEQVIVTGKAGGGAPADIGERIAKAEERLKKAQENLGKISVTKAGDDPKRLENAQKAVEKAKNQIKYLKEREKVLAAENKLREAKKTVELQRKLDKAREELKRQGATQRMYKARTEAEAIEAQIKKAKEDLSKQVGKGLKRAPAADFGHGGGNVTLSTWHNYFMAKQDADLLQKVIGDKPDLGFFSTFTNQGPIGRTTQTLASGLRVGAAGFDFATAFIHGLPMMAADPKAWSKGLANQFIDFANPQNVAEYMARNRDDILEMAKHSIPVIDDEAYEIMQRGGLNSDLARRVIGETGAEVADRIAGAAGAVTRQTLGRFKASYEGYNLVARVEYWKAQKGSWSNLDELGAHIRNLTGNLDSRRLGVGGAQRAAESVWMAFSPRLMRSTLALTWDAATKYDLSSGNPFEILFGHSRGGRARTAMARLSAATTAGYIFVAGALGYDDDVIEEGLQPWNGKKFLSLPMDGEWIGVGGQIRAVTQLLAQAGKAVYEASYNGNTEALSNFTSGDQFKNPLFQYVNSRGAVGQNILRTALEGASGGSWNANPFEDIDTPWDAVKHLTFSGAPFALQGRLEGQSTLATVANIFGARTSRKTPYEVVSEERQLAIDAMVDNNFLPPGSKYNDLGSFEQQLVNAMVEGQKPDLMDWYREERRKNDSIFQRAADRTEEIRQEKWEAFDRILNDLNSGKVTPFAAMQEFNKLEAGMYERMDEARKQIYGDSVDFERNELQKAIDYYKFGIISDNKTAEKIDWDSVKEQRAAFLRELYARDPSFAERVLFNAENSLTPKHPLQELQDKLYDNPAYDQYKNIGDSKEKERFMQANPELNVDSWVINGTGLRSVAAAERALSVSTGREVRLAETSTPITSSNLSAVKQFAPQIEQLLTMDTADNARTDLRKSSLAHDALFYYFSISSGANDNVVYHAPSEIVAWLQRNGFGARPDGKQPRNSP